MKDSTSPYPLRSPGSGCSRKITDLPEAVSLHRRKARAFLTILTCPEHESQPHFENRHPRDCSHSHLEHCNVAVAYVSGTSKIPACPEHKREAHFENRHPRDCSHSYFELRNVAVARVSGTSKIVHAYKNKENYVLHLNL